MPPLRCANANAPATASLFVQLSMRRQAVSGGTRILDLLLPVPSRALNAPAVRAHHVASAARRISPSSDATSSRLWPGTTSHRTIAKRALSTSSPRRTTHAIFNPQVDDNGKEMMLEITPRAAKRLTEIMAKDSNPHLALRIQVESGGCHGFQYLMKLVTLPLSLPTGAESPTPPAAEENHDNDNTIREDDTIFTFAPDETSPPGDLSAPKIILDFPSLELLKGSKVDFTMELIGSQFKIVDNPLATSSCGCGTSFDIKI
ncbi:hypothetical protein VTI74DRAFT_4194 [Chaetomium olivicolor]